MEKKASMKLKQSWSILGLNILRGKVREVGEGAVGD